MLSKCNTCSRTNLQIIL